MKNAFTDEDKKKERTKASGRDMQKPPKILKATSAFPPGKRALRRWAMTRAF